jgi:hypothetical protein
MMVDFKIDEEEDVDVSLRLSRRTPSGDLEAIPLAPNLTEITIIVKVDPDDTDVSPKFDYKMSAGEVSVTNDGTIAGSEFSQILIHVAGADQTPAGYYYYKCEVTRAGKTETVDKGWWHIENV